MQEFIKLMLDSGRTGVELSLYTILPIMVIMMAIMNVLDKKIYYHGWQEALPPF